MSRKPQRSGHEPAWLAEWRRKKRAGLLPGPPTAHLKYGKFSRAVKKSLELERPPLSTLSLDEIDRLEGRFTL